jgi:hypothetical protein
LSEFIFSALEFQLIPSIQITYFHELQPFLRQVDGGPSFILAISEEAETALWVLFIA